MLLINQYSSIDQIPKNAWNDIVDQHNPFCRWEFLKAIEINQQEIKEILNEKLSEIFEQHFEKWLNKNIPDYLEKYFSKKEK